MTKEVVSEERYIEVLNEELKKHEFYQQGMEVVAAPEGASGHNITGYTLKGEKYWPKVLADIAHKVNEKYEVKVS